MCYDMLFILLYIARFMSFYKPGVTLHRTSDGYRGWANPNRFGSTLCLLWPFNCGCMMRNYIKGLIKTHWFYRLLMPKMIRGIFDVPWRVILESGRELRRLNFLFLRCSRFGRGLNKRILGCGRWMLKFGCWETLMARHGFLSVGFTMIGSEESVF